jgi:hypothetical protein
MSKSTAFANLNLPPDWWLMPEARFNLGKWFLKCIVGLFVACKVNGDRQVALYTGFLITIDDNWYWISSGHCVEQIHYIVNNANTMVEINAMRWLDSTYPQNGASIPIAYQYLDMYYTTSTDVGIIKIRQYDRNVLDANPNLRQIGKEFWESPMPLEPIGYYLLGFPGEWGKLGSGVDPESTLRRNTFQSQLATLPLERIEIPEAHVSNEFWEDPTAFYGRIISSDELTPNSVKGMSGGPVFALYHTPEGVTYRLIGVQRSWDKETKAVRVEPVERVLEKLTQAGFIGKPGIV